MEATVETEDFQRFMQKASSNDNVAWQLSLHRSYRNLAGLFQNDRQELGQFRNQLEAIAERAKDLERIIYDHQVIAADYAKQVFHNITPSQLRQAAPNFIVEIDPITPEQHTPFP